jgi:hypothetical protein
MAVSEKVRRQRAYAETLWLEQQERKAARHPSAPLAAKFYPNTQNAALLSNVKRGAVSPLGGQAVSTEKKRSR